MEEVKNSNSAAGEFAKLVDKYDFKEIKRGELVEGKVVKITQNDVIVDIGYKQEGFIPLEECKNPLGDIVISEGSFIKAIVKRITPAEIILSKKEADRKFGWEKVLRAYEKNIPILGTVVERKNRGFIVDVGVALFMPFSQVDIRRLSDKELDEFLGKEVRMKVLSIDRANKTGKVSRRAVLEDDIKEKKRKFFLSKKVGDKVRGKIINAKKTHAIVEIDDYIKALLPKREASWGFLNDIRDKIRVGREYDFKIIELDKEKEKIVVSIKEMTPDPWERVPKKYHEGMKVRGRILRFTKDRRAAIVEIEEGVEAIVRGEDISWKTSFAPPEDFFTINDKFIFKILKLEPEKRRMVVGVKQLEPSPWEVFLNNYKEGDIVDVTVKKIVKSGAFVEILDGVEGFIRKTDLSWNYVNEVEEVLSVNEKVRAMILEINEDKERIKVLLGVKQLQEDEWQVYFTEHKEGDVVKVKVKKEIDNGVVVELSSGVEGLVRKNEISNERFDSISDVIKVGDLKDALILKIDRKARKVYLSFKRAELKEYEKFTKVGDERKLTIGDLIKKEIERKGKPKSEKE